MTRNPSLKDIWLSSWGPMPEFADKIPADLDTSRPPGLWPTDEGLGDMRVVALFNGTTWLSLVKIADQSDLSPSQLLALQTLGFKKGQNGRLIYPSYPNPGFVATVGQIIGSELVPLRPEQMVSLNSAEAFKPKVPLEVQSAIRETWINDKDGMVEEIFESLKEQDPDNLPDYIADHIDRDDPIAPFWMKNPVRLQVWVSQALAGEITPPTEPILSMGLLNGTRHYGPDVNDWPEDAQLLHAELKGYRGVSDDTVEMSDDLYTFGSDKRPNIRSEVKWQQEGHQFSGLVIGLPEDTDTLWVTPTGDSIEPLQQQRKGIPFYVPVRLKISVDDLAGEYAVQADTRETGSPAAPEVTITQTERAAALEAPDADDLHNQPEFTVQDLANPGVANKQPIGELSEALQRRLTLVARASGERGMMFLNPLVLKADTPSNDFVSSWGRLETTFLDQNRSPEEIKADAEIVLRDSLIDQFNEAQPKTVGGVQSPLAVLPLGHQMTNVNSRDPAIIAEVDKIQFCRIGLHPKMIPAVGTAMEAFLEDDLPAIKTKHREIYSHLVSTAFNFVNQMGLSFDTLSMGSTSTSSQFFRQQFIQKERIYTQNKEYQLREAGNPAGTLEDSVEMSRQATLAWIDYVNSEEGKQQFADEMTGIFSSYQEAGEYINGQSPEAVAQLADKNRRLIAAAAEIAGVAPSDIENTRHPVQIVLGTIEQNGLNSFDRAETMARIGLDLSNNAHWLGQMIEMNGVTLDMAHRSQLIERPGETTEQHARDHGEMTRIRPTVRLEAYSGFISRNGARIPYQVAILDQQEDLFESSRENLRKNNVHLLDTRDTSIALGRLADVIHLTGKGIGEPLEMDNQLLRPESLDSLQPAIIGSQHFGTTSHQVLSSKRLSFSALNDASEVSEFNALGTSGPGEMQAIIKENREILLTGTPSFNRDERLKEEVKGSLNLFLQDFKPLQHLSRPEKFVDPIMQELVAAEGAEMVVITAKATRSRVRWFTRLVTSNDLEKAGFDRRIAAEEALLQIKQRHPSVNKTWKHYDVLDLANVLRPEAMRYLNELSKQNQRKEHDSETKDDPKPRGARQDRGKVAGLAIKDLRGSRTNVLKKLSKASAEDQGKFITKTKLWESPDWAYLRAPSEEDRNEGARPMEPAVAYFFNELRKQIGAAPPANIPEINQIYARFVLAIRDNFDRIRTKDELGAALKEGGDLYELTTATNEEIIAKGWRFSLVLGEELNMFRAFRPSNDDTQAVFWREYESALRKTASNTQWAIKEAKPGTGRKPAISTNIELDGDDEEQQDLTGAMPMLSRLVRQGGEDYRGDTDITEEAVIQTFGFSGIEYGKSMNQADRTAYLNHAYDSFLDMSKLLKVPPKALSLGGTLGLAFGSRGRGGRRAAAAHFEPMNNAINLTRMNGAGTMAHEFGHALANYFFRISRGLQGSRAPGDVTRILNNQIQNHQAIVAGQLREPVAKAIASVLMSLKYRPLKDDEQYARDESMFVRGARNADIQDGRAENPYWSTIEEMFARGFETYVSVALKDQAKDFRNDFLVRNDKLAVWGDGPMDRLIESQKFLTDSYEKYGRRISEVRRRAAEKFGDDTQSVDNMVNQIMRERREAEAKTPILYPSGDERENMKKAFGGLFDALKTKDAEVQHEHLGRQTMPILYSSASGLAERIGERDHQALAACVMEEVARMCGGGVLTKWQDEIRTENGEKAAGRYTSRKKASEKVKGVIEMAFNAGLHTAHHEAFHFAQDHLLESGELAMLDNQFGPGSELTDRLVMTLIKQGRSDAVDIVRKNPREAQAYAYEEWVKGNLDMKIKESPSSVFGRISSLFTRTSDLAKKSGFKTPEQVFMAFYAGTLRERAENKQREMLKAHAPSQESGESGFKGHSDRQQVRGNMNSNELIEFGDHQSEDHQIMQFR